ncbi:hypothetical protein L6654_24160 [Bradyrhizobium sp. WYCCWR 13023]|uniref:Uncharacterized protein n=1 Tax=Bradyrhizobium zhengyangense TaxID=2911009 RepID=A0A9X1R9A3_9BRAD|nr:hypothetical protein [Bradyrhizobium zhengyangense]MCG2629722.1 hypothetical protein [Bradyrhizobium zhengyangense]
MKKPWVVSVALLVLNCCAAAQTSSRNDREDDVRVAVTVCGAGVSTTFANSSNATSLDLGDIKVAKGSEDRLTIFHDSAKVAELAKGNYETYTRCVGAMLAAIREDRLKAFPTRSFLAPHDVPPSEFAAYGIVAFPQRATSQTLSRHQAICEAYVATLPPASKNAASSKEQMVTVWPVETGSMAKRLTEGATDCKLAVEKYDLATSLTALKEAQNQEGSKLSGEGPYLLGWAPSKTKGMKDAIVLIADLSGTTTDAQYLEYFRRWREDIEKKPELWSRGWSETDLRVLIRNWADRWGTTILSVVHAQ